MDLHPALVLVSLVGLAISFLLLYLVVKAAVLAALRQHTKTSQTAVIVRESVPVRLVAEDPPAVAQEPPAVG